MSSETENDPTPTGSSPVPAKTKKKRVHPVDEVPPAGKLVTLGVQHVIAFYAGAVLVPLIIAGAIGLDDEDEVGDMVASDHTGLSNLEEDEHDNIVEMAKAYRQQFGFPLVICARETERYERVLRNGWTRMDNSAPSEKSFALIEIAKIANYRFDDLVADANPIISARFNRFQDVMG